MRAPLTVRINDGNNDRITSRRASGLRFRKVAQGGHADASCSLAFPDGTFPKLGPADRMWVYGPTGQTIWEGYTNNPGRTQRARAGKGQDVAAFGGMYLATDRSEVLVYLDTSLDRWTVDWLNAQAPSANIGVGQFPDDAGTRAGQPCIFVQFTPGQPLVNGSVAGMRYAGFIGSPMKLGAFAGFYDGGQSDTNFRLQWFFPGSAIADLSQSTSGNGIEKYGTGTDFTPALGDSVGFKIRRFTGGATNVATDNVWGCFGEVKVLGQLLDRFGAERPMSTTAHVTIPVTPLFAETVAYILASEVVEDLVGRVLTLIDPNTSSIATTAFHIDQLAYSDPTNAATVLDDLALYEPDYLWEILESGANGKHRMNYRAWPTAPRYVIGSRDNDIEVPGSDSDLCNRILVNWTDSMGSPVTRAWGAEVSALGVGSPVNNTTGVLDPAYTGRIHDADPINLPDSHGSLSQAERIALQILEEKADPPEAARATIGGPILDIYTGRMVKPWEIVPGYVGQIQSSGVQLRLQEMEYDDEAGTASLQLGAPVLTTSQRLVRLTAKTNISIIRNPNQT